MTAGACLFRVSALAAAVAAAGVLWSSVPVAAASNVTCPAPSPQASPTPDPRAQNVPADSECVVYIDPQQWGVLNAQAETIHALFGAVIGSACGVAGTALLFKWWSH